MTHLDTLRRMHAVRPCGRNCGCGGCQERAALEEAIRVMEREAQAAAAPVLDRTHVGGVCWITDEDDTFTKLRERYPEAAREAADNLRATARALETP